MGHALGTGALDPGRGRPRSRRPLTGAELLDELRHRTLGTGNGGFNPIGYHTGSVWTHDTAIFALGLAREGHGARRARRRARCSWPRPRRSTTAGPSSTPALPLAGPAPYPASCRPQAWSAASAGALLTVALGLRADAATRTLHLHPMSPAPFGALTVEGIRFCDSRIDLAVSADGIVEVISAPDDVTVVTD